MKEYQKRAAKAQDKRWKEKGIIRVTLRIGSKDKEKFKQMARESRSGYYTENDE